MVRVVTMQKDEIFKLIEEIYLRLAGRYGEPVLVGNSEVWWFEGIYEELNKELQKRGMKLTWEEFKELLRELDSSYPSKIFVTFIVSPKGSVEPHDITFFEPVFLR